MVNHQFESILYTVHMTTGWCEMLLTICLSSHYTWLHHGGPGGVSTVQASLRTGGRSLPRSPRSLVSVQLVEIIKELSHQIFSLPCLVSALCLHICIGNSIFTFHVTVKKTSSGSRNHSIDTSPTRTNAGPLEIKSRCHLLQTPDNDSMSQHLLQS